jgi:Tol biopolymer transport system component/tRNA A-37 threonylcarbamoyl transferase component Bud32
MILAPGARLGPYEIVAPLGAGGMGEVYKARDTRLNRIVAIKVADQRFTERFQREAEAIASLNHQNICQLYDVGPNYLVMEYVEGSRLAPIDHPGKLLDVAVQIADGMSAAHEAGIVHRDLKPDNILVRRDGCVKILDFGLAKSAEHAAIAASDVTRTKSLTSPGTTVGTIDYMSPEQARGEPNLTPQSDQFSFGLVLYELATGRRAFRRSSNPETLAAIIRDNAEPLPASVPAPLRWITERLLAKEASERYDSTRDLYRELKRVRDGLSQAPGSAQTAPSAIPVSRWTGLRNAAWFLALAAVVLAAVWFGIRGFHGSPDAAGLRTVRFTITPRQLLRGGDGQIDAEVSVSPDGKHIAYVESQGGQLWVRDIDTEAAHPVPGATAVYQAFWSPDNRFIGYSTGLGCGGHPCDLVRIPIEGGTPQLITKLKGPFRRASWSSDGETILYGEAPNGLFTVPARGGPPTQVITHPHLEHPSWVDLPGGRHAYLYQTADPHGSPPLPHSVYIQVVGENQPRLVVTSASTNPYPAYSPSGHIIYVDGNGDSTAIWALPFSLSKLQATGKAFPIAQHGASPMMSRSGTLVYGDVPSSRWQLKWVDRSGATLSNIGEPQRQDAPSLSPDGHELAVQGTDGGGDLWVYHLDTGIRTRFAFDAPVDGFTTWTPSGDEITYAALREGSLDIFSKPSKGDGEPKLLVGTPMMEHAPDWSPDRKFLIYEAAARGAKRQLFYRERRPDGTLGDAVSSMKSSANDTLPKFSPDGHYVAYVSDASGRNEVYVREFPGGANAQQVSASGGNLPRWSRTGKEIFYVGGRRLFAVSVLTKPVFSGRPPEPLFEFHALSPLYDVSADGKRFVILDRPADEPPLAIHVVHNWFEEFRGREPR